MLYIFSATAFWDEKRLGRGLKNDRDDSEGKAETLSVKTTEFCREVPTLSPTNLALISNN